MKSAAVAVLLVVVSAVAGASSGMVLGGLWGWQLGTQQYDGILGIYSGWCFGFVLGIVAGVVGARRLENRRRLIATAIAALLALFAVTFMVYWVNTAPVR